MFGGKGGFVCYFCNTFDFGLMAGEEIRLNVISFHLKTKKFPSTARGFQKWLSRSPWARSHVSRLVPIRPCQTKMPGSFPWAPFSEIVDCQTFFRLCSDFKRKSGEDKNCNGPRETSILFKQYWCNVCYYKVHNVYNFTPT